MIGFCVVGSLFAGCLLGCGESTGRQSVYGKVTLDNEPVVGGHISLAPQEGTNVRQNEGHTITATTDDEGNYEIDDDVGPTLGTYRVGINWKKPTGQKTVEPNSGIEMDVVVEAIPYWYNAQTRLEVQITDGSNQHDFELKTTE